jgi:hypothetical protein
MVHLGAHDHGAHHSEHRRYTTAKTYAFYSLTGLTQGCITICCIIT